MVNWELFLKLTWTFFSVRMLGSKTLVSSTLIMQCPAARKLIHGRLSSSKFACLIPFSLSFTLSLCMVPNFATLVGHTL